MLGEQKQHIQGRVARSESKMVILDEVVEEKERLHVNCDDGFHDLADCKEDNRSVVKRICFCTFSCNAVKLGDFQADDR